MCIHRSLTASMSAGLPTTFDTNGSMGLEGVNGRGRGVLKDLKSDDGGRDNDTDERTVRMIRCRGMREWDM